MEKFELIVLNTFVLFFAFACIIVAVVVLHTFFKWKEGVNKNNK